MTDEKVNTGSLLGQKSEFTGKLTFMGTVRIEGRFEGEIFSDETLVVGTGAEIHGTINVDTLIVTGGVVEAKINARTCVELYPPGQINGEVTTPSFQMEKGAVFRGQCVMPDVPPEPEPNHPDDPEDDPS